MYSGRGRKILGKESLLLTAIAVAKISSLAYTASSSSKTQKATWRNQVTSGHAVEMCLRKGNLSLGIQVFNNRLKILLSCIGRYYLIMLNTFVFFF